MREMIDCFLPDFDREAMSATVGQLSESKAVRNIYWTEGMASTSLVTSIAERARAPYVLLFTKPAPVVLGQRALERMLRTACDSGAPMVYADRTGHPAIDYQLGSIRDDFDFGSLWLVKTSLLQAFALQAGEQDYQFAGLYALRLKRKSRQKSSS